MRDEKHEGLVLRSLDFKDREKIITLFTPKKGLISLIVKGITRKKSHLLTLTAPLTHAEYLITIGKTDLYRFRDGTPLETHNAIRKSYAHIETAATFTKSILASQFPEKKAPNLYQLTLTYLKHLPDFDDPIILASSFLLKLLIHDGHLALTNTCAHCDQPPTHLYEGEPYCKSHAPARVHPFTPTEWETLKILAHARTIKRLKEALVSTALHQKVIHIFHEKGSLIGCPDFLRKEGLEPSRGNPTTPSR